VLFETDNETDVFFAPQVLCGGKCSRFSSSDNFGLESSEFCNT